MRITWSLPVPGEPVDSGRGDIVRARRLFEGLRDLGHDVQVVAGSEQAQAGAMVSTYRSGIRALLPSAMAGPVRDLGRLAFARIHARRVADAVTRQGSQVLVETQVHLVPSGRLAAERVGVPLVLDDCSPPSEESVLGKGLPGTLVSRSFQAQTRAAMGLVVPSHTLARRLGEWGGNRLSVVPNGVDQISHADRMQAPECEESRSQARQRVGLGDGPVIAFVGSFQPWHRVELLVEAVASMDLFPPPKLLLVGGGPSLPAALARSRELGIEDQVHSLGMLPPSSVPQFLAAADLGVVPGTNDWGQPMKIVDYAAAGLPVVAPDLPPVREVMVPGRTGLLFPPDDLGALRSALEKLCRDPVLRACMGEAGQELARGWSWRERALQFQSVLEGVLDGVGPGTADVSTSGRRTA